MGCSGDKGFKNDGVMTGDGFAQSIGFDNDGGLTVDSCARVSMEQVLIAASITWGAQGSALTRDLINDGGLTVDGQSTLSMEQDMRLLLSHG